MEMKIGYRIKYSAVLTFMSLGLFALLLISCGKGEEVETEAPIRPVKLFDVTSGSDIRQLNLPAIIEASNTSVLTFQVPGTLEELNVIEGQEVSKGAIIGRLNQRDYNNALQQANAQFTAADSEFQRASRLLAQEAISRSIYEQRKSARDIAQAALDTARKSLDDTTLVSPFDGVIATVSVEQFDNVGPQQEIVRLQTVGAAEALVQIPSTLVANSEKFEPVEAYITLDAANGVRIPAELLSYSTLANTATQTFAVRFSFTPPAEVNILPGMTGTLHSTLRLLGAGNEGAVISIPLNAVLTEGEQIFVWVVDRQNMTVSKREVTLVDGAGDMLVVESGLQEGETIVGAGASYLFEGMKIRPYKN